MSHFPRFWHIIFSSFQKIISLNQINIFQRNTEIFFFCICLKVFTKNFSDAHRAMPIFENGSSGTRYLQNLVAFKKYIKNQCSFGAFCLKTFSHKDNNLQGFSDSYEMTSAEFNSVKLFKSYSHLKIVILLETAFFDNFKPPPFISTCF